jgi:Transferase family
MSVLPLSVLDQFYATDWVDGVQFILHYDAALDVKRVEEAFHKTARQFLGVHGTLVALDDHRLGIDLSREVAEVRVCEVQDRTAAKQAVVPFVSRIGGSLAEAYIFARADGGSSIALNFSHALADGYGCFLFLAAWAAECRGQAGHAPYCERKLLNASEAASPERAPRSGMMRDAGFTLASEDARGPRLPWRERMRSAASFAAAGAADQRVSQNDVLCATLWQELEAEAEERATHFICANDVRRQLGPAGPVYFGNATLIATVSRSTSELRAADTLTVATWIRDAIAGTPAKMKDALAELEQVRSAYGLALLPCIRTMPEQGLSVTNLSRVPFAVVDFGRGAPSGADLTAEAPRQQCSIVLAAGKDFRLLETRRASA